MKRLTCVGTLTRSCPAHAWWYYSGTGSPRRRCRICFAQEHREHNALDRAVMAGVDERSATVGLLLREARSAILARQHAEGMRLTRRAMAMLGGESERRSA